MAYNKTGEARYNVTTDTHGYPWGYRNGVNNAVVDFDLGDNTTGCAYGEFDEPEFMDIESDIKLNGNHDVVVKNWNENSIINNKYVFSLQTHWDYTHKVIFFGLDTGTINHQIFNIPDREINDMADIMDDLGDGWDIVVLTHIPLFPGTLSSVPGWDCGYSWDEEENKFTPSIKNLLNLLHAYKKHGSHTTPNNKVHNYSSKTGYVIGCFAGHIHNHVKCIYKGIYMEAFNTNGADEWSTSTEFGYYNMGVYQPEMSYIDINFSTKKVNGISYDNEDTSSNKDFLIFPNQYHLGSDCYYLDKASGYFKLKTGTTAHPKFYNDTYIGYSSSPLDGTEIGKNTRLDRYWPLGEVVSMNVSGQIISARVLWFDTNGRLRYYSNRTDFDDSVSGRKYTDRTMYTEIPNYKTATVTFKSTNNINWHFQNGLLYESTPTYCSGSLKGKNGYSFEFNASGIPTGISLNGSAGQDYGAGQNFVNYTDVKIYDDGTLIHITQIPQIGITGTFNSSSKINLARADSNGVNRISSPNDLLLRVQDINGKGWWLYDGKLTTLTDEQVL